jgi:arginyl-tRNA synthetase
MFEREIDLIETQINSIIESQDISVPILFEWNQIPFSGEWGLSISFFKLASEEARAKKGNINVPTRATELAEIVAEQLGDQESFSRIEAVRGYLNLYFAAPDYSTRVLEEIMRLDKDYGRGSKKDLRFMVEFSQPNTHKAFHVGHLRNVILGDALARILDFAGIDVIRANYIGDFGKDVFKWIWNYRARHAGEVPPKKDVTRWMGDLYAEATKALEEDPNSEKEIRELFSRWEKDDQEIHDQWAETRQWSLDGFNEIYAAMDISFDRLYYESEVEEPGKELVQRFIDEGIAIDERAEGGPVIVKVDELLGLEDEQYRVLVLLRSDGTSLYGAWDLALTLLKFKEFELDKSVYVVDVRQSLHFQQVFKTLEIAGYGDLIEKVHHLPYEIVNLPGNLTLSSREGVVVLLEDFIREATARSEEAVLEKNPDMEEIVRKDVAQAVGLGSIKFPMLARDNAKIATFDWETALDLNGQAAPYIQYAHVRAISLLKRYGKELPELISPDHQLSAQEIQLINQLAQFEETIQRAAKEFKTLHITNFAFACAKAFNEFYNQTPVLKADTEIRDFRLNLVEATRITIANALSVLGIQAPEAM